jgi:hypothetical protein
MATYRKRYKPSPEGKMRLTEDDLVILRQVYQHRFLTSQHVKTLLPGRPETPILRRLRKLTDHRYLSRPPQQQHLHYFVKGSLPLVYALGDKGAATLEQVDGISRQKIRWQEKNRAVGREHLEHTLRTTDTMLAFEMACKQNGLAYVSGEDLLKTLPEKIQAEKNPFASRVIVFVEGQQLSLPVIPDGVFQFSNAKGNRILGLIETDRATMQVSVSRPITAKSFDRTSVFKKLVAYWRALDTHHFQDRYNAEGILIFFITTSQERIMTVIDNLKEARRIAGADRHDGPSDGHFFFGVQKEIRAESVFSYPWVRGNGQVKSLG